MNLKLAKIIDKLSLVTAIISIIGAIYYRFFQLDTLGVILVIIFSIISYLIIIYLLKKVNRHDLAEEKAPLKIVKNEYNKLQSFILSFLFLTSILVSFFVLFKSRTNLSLISPWQSIPNYFFFLISLSFFLLVINIISKSKLSLFFVIIFSFLFNSIAIIVYKFGFGFDFFIHQATMELINASGAVDPRPLYYLGQYSLIIILHKVFFIPIYYLHLLLVPVLASLLLPINLYSTLKDKFSSQTNIYLTISILMTLPLALFFNTTPQNLAYLFLILVIIRGLRCKTFSDIVYIFVFSISALLIQPIAGIPALFLSLAIAIHHADFNKEIQKHFYRLLFILSAISLPLAFFILDYLKGDINTARETLTTSFFNDIFSKISLQNPCQENVILNFIYFFIFNIQYLFLILLLFGVYTVYKYKDKFQIYKIYLLISLGIFLSFIIVSNQSFDYLIIYERSAFANRIFTVFLLLLIPFFMVSIFALLDSLKQKNNSIKIIFLTFSLFLIPTFLYASYPRIDNYHNSHGYSVGQSDIDTVRWVDTDANDDYIVLANQQTSVAALREFGFKKYYKTNKGEDIFYYPIPTGAPLYKYFLTMVNEKPTRKTMLKAMQLANVDTAYFVINKYWWAFDKIIEEAKLETDTWKNIDNGDVFVFRFNK